MTAAPARCEAHARAGWRGWLPRLVVPGSASREVWKAPGLLATRSHGVMTPLVVSSRVVIWHSAVARSVRLLPSEK